ncbi:hypothetical protein OB920_14080 [Halobacteria archaeon HArc-gm2]|nr:hypothetical protein [Halobacteria archaeon HArc-gm2]
MPKLDVQLWVDDRTDVVTYTVDGDLKRPGDAIERAREEAASEGYAEVNLKEVSLREPAQ